MNMGTEREIVEKARAYKDAQTAYLKSQRASNRALADMRRAKDDLLEII